MAKKVVFQRFAIIMPDAEGVQAKPVMPYGLAVDMCLQLYRETEGDYQAMLVLGKAIYKDFRVHSPNEPKGWDQFVSCLKVSAEYCKPPIDTSRWPVGRETEDFYFHDPVVIAETEKWEAEAKTKHLDWLARQGQAEEVPLDEAVLLEPVPEPPQIFPRKRRGGSVFSGDG